MLTTIGFTLTWTDFRIFENDLVRSIVVHCTWTIFEIAELYEKTLPSRLMATMVGLLPHIIASKNDAAQEDDIVHLITLYARYGRTLGEGTLQ